MKYRKNNYKTRKKKGAGWAALPLSFSKGGIDECRCYKLLWVLVACQLG